MQKREKMRIVCIGAHPDDVELGMGGTIAHHVKNNDDVSIILCTLGGVSGDPEKRKRETINASKILGVKDLRILNYPVSKLNKPEAKFSRILKSELDEIKPDRMYTHSPKDFHQVHVGVSKSAIKASENIGQILFFETISSTMPEFFPNAYCDITKFIKQKIESLKAHQSQRHRFYLKPNVVKSIANTRYVWGKIGPNSRGYAESFYIHRFIC
jgi:LmbE family N-acetylglucosaminyl deacetylase